VLLFVLISADISDSVDPWIFMNMNRVFFMDSNIRALENLRI